MSRRIQLEASVACANRMNLQDDLRHLSEAGIDVLHIDIMDGRFVSNFCPDFSTMQAKAHKPNEFGRLVRVDEWEMGS